MKRAAVALVVGTLLAFATARAGELPARIDPAAPFPRIIEQAPTVESIAPGIEYGDYQLETAAGPLAVHVVAVEPHRSDVRLDSVVAGDSLVSKGETVGSMARRTRAVAGINADFFDIGNTNRPVNMVVRAGALLQVPYKRYVFGDNARRRRAFRGVLFLGRSRRERPHDAAGQRSTICRSRQRPRADHAALTADVPPRENVTLVSTRSPRRRSAARTLSRRPASRII